MRIKLAAFLLAGMSLVPYASAAVWVHGPPPRPLVVHAPAIARPGFVWVPGYWHPAGPRWAWRGGYWARPPFRHAYWAPPRYFGHRYYAGYWRR
jgi:hypothetical protein